MIEIIKFMKDFKRIREENSKPRLLYFFPNRRDLKTVLQFVNNVNDTMEKINRDEPTTLMSAYLGNYDVSPVIHITVEDGADADTLFGYKLRTLFEEVGMPKHIFNGSKIRGLDQALEPFGKITQLDREFIGGDTQKIVDIKPA